MSYSALVLANSPVLYARLGDTSGTTALDSSGNGNNGAYTGGFTLNQAGLIAGDSDKAVALDGTGYVDFGMPAFDDVLTQITLECLLKVAVHPEDGEFYYLISLGDPSSGSQGYYLRYGNEGGTSTIRCGVYAGADLGASHAVTLTVGVAYHLAATFDGIDWRLYLNGAQVGVNDQADDAPFDSSGGLWVGGLDSLIGPLYLAKATIDEAAIYTSSLSGAEILAHYNAATTAAAPRPQNRLSLGLGLGL